jgi:hypothetical protein
MVKLAKITETLPVLIFFSKFTICTASNSSFQPVSGFPSSSRPDDSLVQNIAFSVVATMLTITGVIITYLQYRHIRKSVGEEITASLDLETQVSTTSIEVQSAP